MEDPAQDKMQILSIVYSDTTDGMKVYAPHVLKCEYAATNLNDVSKSFRGDGVHVDKTKNSEGELVHTDDGMPDVPFPGFDSPDWPPHGTKKGA